MAVPVYVKPHNKLHLVEFTSVQPGNTYYTVRGVKYIFGESYSQVVVDKATADALTTCEAEPKIKGNRWTLLGDAPDEFQLKRDDLTDVTGGDTDFAEQLDSAGLRTELDVAGAEPDILAENGFDIDKVKKAKEKAEKKTGAGGSGCEKGTVTIGLEPTSEVLTVEEGEPAIATGKKASKPAKTGDLNNG
jgi:hypothetical protein